MVVSASVSMSMSMSVTMTVVTRGRALSRFFLDVLDILDLVLGGCVNYF